ncbi:cupin domain-containing protein [Ornithinimicrobium cavernae]|uniref:cupin domain-containing protein n=1 Tax=Ornithinimicrobium cavernae TaxID=2666047 RepID=UPI001379565D|nr:cupin domain-containing protein [Ornithinimicrobium cavernae]
MPHDTTPGTYVEETGHDVRIEPLPTSVTAFVGACAQGPVGTPVRVTSAADYHATFGPSLDPARPLGHAVDLFFANGGPSAVIVRAAGEAPEDLVPEDGTAYAEALEGVGVTVLVVPGLTTSHTAVVRRALSRCAAYGAVLLLDPPPGPWSPATEGDLGLLTEHRERAAVYHPWVTVGGVGLSPSGAVAGVIARTDAASGVWKPPAGSGADVRGIDGLLGADPRTAERLAQVGVNALRDFAGTGTVVWGARVLAGSSEPAERYLSVRRLVDHVQRSVSQGLGWAALEPAGASTWQRVRSAAEVFLDGLWRQGALSGTTSEEAYFVRVGLGETMTQADLVAGRLIVELGIAPLRPAEFHLSRVTVQTPTVGSMEGFVIDRTDGRDDGEEWAENYERLPGGAGVSLILESTTREGVGPRLHRHPYAETFVIRRGSAVFTIAGATVTGHAGQVLVVPAQTPHTFATGPGGYEAVHIHAAEAFETEWLE